MSYLLVALVVVAVLAGLLALRLTAGLVLVGVVLATLLSLMGVPDFRLFIFQQLHLDTGDAVLDNTARYRVEISFSVGNANAVGHAVQQISLRNTGGTMLTNGTRFIEETKGEAVVVPLPNGSALVALMNVGGAGLFRAACAIRLGAAGDVDQLIQRVASFKGTCEVRPEDLPIFVLLTDPTEPRTLRHVDPLSLPPEAGADVKFVRATITTTEDPLTFDIKRTLPWVVHGTPKNNGQAYLQNVNLDIPLYPSHFIYE